MMKVISQRYFNIDIPISWDIKRFEDIADIDKESLSKSTSKDYEFQYISLSDVVITLSISFG